MPTPEQAVGWRGDGTGRYPGATPPKEWYLRVKNAPGLASASSKPKGPPAKLDHVADIALNDWIAVGPWVASDLKVALDTPYIADEITVEPSDGDKADGKQWKKLPMQNGAVNLADVFGQTTRDPGQPVYEEPKQQNLIYAVTYIYSPVDGEAGLYTTHANGYRIYLDGKVVSKRDATGQNSVYGGIPRMDKVTLKQGWNRLLLKSYGSRKGPYEHGWAFSAWLKMFPAKGTKPEFESKNMVYKIDLPRGSMGKTPGPIVVGDKLFLTGEHYLAAFRKLDGQLLWYRTILAFDGRAQDTVVGKDDAALAEQYNADCKKMHELDEQYPQQFKDGKLAPSFEKQCKQVSDKLSTLLQKLDQQRVSKLKSSWEQGEPGWAMTPCSDGKFVYAWSELATAVCYDLAGKPQWLTTVEHAGNVHHGYAISPILTDGKFVCAQANLWAFDAKTGKLEWNAPRKGSQWGSLIRSKAGSETVIVEQGNFIRSLANGQILPGDKGGKNTGENCCSSSIPVDSNRIFATFGTLDFVDLSAAGAQHVTMPWPDSVGCGGLYADQNIASPVYHDGFAYIFTMGGTLITIDLKAGKFANSEHLDTRVSWSGRPGVTASPAFAGGLLYFFDDSGNTVIREPDPKGKTLARNSLVTANLDNSDHLEPTNSSPVFDSSRIYWRVNSWLYCIGEK